MVLKKFFAVVVCCFLLSALALPSFAYDTPDDLYHTRWLFDEVLSGEAWGGDAWEIWGLQMNLSFGSGNLYYPYSNLFYDGDRLVTYSSTDSSPLVLYDRQSGGWTNPAYRYMYFDLPPQDPPVAFLSWLANNAVNVSFETTYYPLVSVFVTGFPDGSSVRKDFSGSRPSSAITLSVSSEGGYFTHGLRTWFVSSVSASRFLGFDMNGDGVADYVPGETYEIGSGFNVATNVPLVAVYSELPTLTTTVSIYNNDGTYRRFSYTATSSDPSSGLSPVLRMRINAYGANFYSGNTLVATWLVEGNDEDPEGFLGLTGKRFGNFPSYGLGADITLGGESTSSEYTFYIVYNTMLSTPDADWTSWIITAVGGFFNFELWPGLSLGDLLLVVISIGVLFAFLKITI